MPERVINAGKVSLMPERCLYYGNGVSNAVTVSLLR